MKWPKQKLTIGEEADKDMERYYLKCQECGDHAFEFKKKPKAGQPLFAEDIVGEVVQPGEEITCKSCYKPIPNMDLTIRNIVTVK